MGKRRIVALSDYGVHPDSLSDFASAFNKYTSEDTARCMSLYRFLRGTYRYYVHSKKGTKKEQKISEEQVVFEIKGKKNLIIDGDGSKLIMFGNCLPFSIKECENIVLRNFTIDADKPTIAEGKVVNRCADYIDVIIDTALFPCYVRDWCLYFDSGDKEATQLTYGTHTVYDGASLTVSLGNSDHIMVSSAKKIDENVFRLYLSGLLTENMPPRVGDIIVLRHNKNLYPGIRIKGCKDISLENITLYACSGTGIEVTGSENVSFTKVNMIPNRKIGRKVGGIRSGGITARDCFGKIRVEECSFHGLQDTPVHVCGSCSVIMAKPDKNTFDVSFNLNLSENSKDESFVKGDVVSVIERASLKSLCTLTVSDVLSAKDNLIRLRFDENIPENVLTYSLADLGVENLTRTPALTVKNNYFGSCRSRGLIFNTPKKVIVEGNLFESAGAAILIGGDAIFWYGVGRSSDVEIRSNVFSDCCMLSRYHNSNAMITINPEIPKPAKNTYYHSNILVEDNVFSSPDTPIIYANSVDGLLIKNNRIVHSLRGGREHDIKQLIFVKNGNNIKLSENVFTGKFILDKTKFDNCTSVDTKGK